MWKFLPDSIRWTELYYASFAIFGLILFSAVFEPFWAAILSFVLVCLWSRVPCMMSDYAKDLEVVDFFTVLVAVNLGGQVGAFFGAGNLWFSRLFGKIEHPIYTFNDSVAFAVSGLLTPWVYGYWHGNLLLTMYTFTAIRYIVYFLVALITSGEMIVYEVQLLLMGIFVAYMSNTALVYLFGDYVTRLFTKGLGLDWGLFGFIIVVLGLAYLSHTLEGTEWKPCIRIAGKERKRKA